MSLRHELNKCGQILSSVQNNIHQTFVVFSIFTLWVSFIVNKQYEEFLLTEFSRYHGYLIVNDIYVITKRK